MSARLRREHRFAVVPEHLIRDKALSDRAVRLWCLLDRYAGKDGAAFPSRDRLHEDMGCSKPTIDRAITELVDAGWLSKRPREAGGVNEYTLLIAKLTPLDAKRQVRGTPLITGDEGSDHAPLITGDDTPSSPMTTPLITGDDQKEASLRDTSTNETSDADSASARGDNLTPRPDTDSQDVGDTAALAESIASVWWEHYERTHHTKIIGNRYVGFRKNIIQASLDKGIDPDVIKRTLVALDVAYPSIQQWQAAVEQTLTGRSKSAPSNVHRLPPGHPERERMIGAFK